MTTYGQPRPPARRRGGAALALVLVVAALMTLGMVTVVVVWVGGRPVHGFGPATDGAGGWDGGQAADVAGSDGGGGNSAGSGAFRPARGSSTQVGSGRVYSYRIEVEKGIDITPEDFAGRVDQILADPRGWTASGRWGFRRVPAAPADFVVKLATPATVDRICGQYGLSTDGEASCRGGPNVIINLKRWTQATPAYADDVAMYQHLVINHEVGHFLGFNHAQCRGSGQLAPVMQTQMYGLHGCKRNAWPYP